MTKITFYRGLRTIGGTFAAIETDKARCVFDFGFTVDKRCDDKIKVRKGCITRDYIYAGMLPAVDGMYDEDTADVFKIVSKEKYPKKTFMLMSHMHIDHMGGIGLMHKDIPVYMSNDSLKLYRELIKWNDIQFFPHDNCIGMADGEEIKVEDIKVKLVPVDHDVIGAAGYLITTPDGSIVYTGDYRFHGYHPETTEGFAKTVHGADLFITESVTVSFDDIDMPSLTKPEEAERTEYSLLEEMRLLSNETDKLIVINPYNRNVERVHNLIGTFEKEGRKLVLDERQASYVKAFYPDRQYYVYEPVSEEKKLAGDAVYISREELLEHKEKYVLQLDYENMYEIYDIADAVSCYIHMDGSPLGDYDPSYASMKLILEKLGIEYRYMSIGGHAKPYYLKHMIEAAEPAVFVPLHGFRPEQFDVKNGAKRILPEEGQSFELKNHEVKAM